MTLTQLNTETMTKKLELGKKAGGDENPDLQNMLGGGEQPNGSENPTEGSENPTEGSENSNGQQAPEATAESARKVGHPATVTFYTRVGDQFDSKTGKERPVRKHVVTYAEWLRIKNRLARLGYNLVKVED